MITPFKTTLTWHQNLVSQSVVQASPTTNPSAQQIFNEITRSLPQISDYTGIVYSSLSPDDAELICRSLDAHTGVEGRSYTSTMLPAVGCQRCIKWEFARGEPCPCVRAVANQKCQRCQRLKKSCKAVPTQLRRCVAAALAVPVAEHDANEVKLLAREMKSTSDHVPQIDMQQTIHTIQSLNHNVFRMLGALNTLAGLPVPDDEEEMLPIDKFAGEVGGVVEEEDDD
ncbi:hypothetical protein CNMCM5793_009216 [Aspergillus hiratsukae]|uniref:Uncharacterized protein n=1 Tax=Aspergillus hiratsukae TaxID=1194566 RepID=A0A8H6P0A8_9EURO|nr:hypothetical protein CNMCM5793_009216 [Aspergillus hiratsukae]KAF7155689.1 hypothetical protein CNMCM6106_005971 [Aspergillus hiratsukae]